MNVENPCTRSKHVYISLGALCFYLVFLELCAFRGVTVEFTVQDALNTSTHIQSLEISMQSLSTSIQLYRKQTLRLFHMDVQTSVGYSEIVIEMFLIRFNTTRFLPGTWNLLVTFCSSGTERFYSVEMAGNAVGKGHIPVYMNRHP